MTQHIYRNCHSDSHIRSVRARHTTQYSHKVAHNLRDPHTQRDCGIFSSRPGHDLGMPTTLWHAQKGPPCRYLLRVCWICAGKEEFNPQIISWRSASGDVDMMKVMVGARVESDRARSVLDGRGRLHAVLPMAQSAGVPTDDGRCRRRATPRELLSVLTRVCK